MVGGTFEPDAVICFPRRERASHEEVLLIRKKRGIGAGLYNGPGGKLEPGETAREAARRETREEVGLTVTDLRVGGDLHFVFGTDPFMDVRVFLTRSVRGTPRESAEADPEWVRVENVPYDRMWADDRHWLPHVLAGKCVTGRFYFDAEGDTLRTWTLDVRDPD